MENDQQSESRFFNWHIDLKPLFAGRVRIETEDGHIRVGKITNIEYNTMVVFGRTIKSPSRVVVDRDESDYIEWRFIRYIKQL